MYVDNDPMVLVHARALLTSTREGATHYIDADEPAADELLASDPLALILGMLLDQSMVEPWKAVWN